MENLKDSNDLSDVVPSSQRGQHLITTVTTTTNNNNENENENELVADDAISSHSNVAECASEFAKTAFVSCDQPLLGPGFGQKHVFSNSIFPRHPAFRGEPILKPTLKLFLGENNNAAADDDAGGSTTTSLPSSSLARPLLTIPSIVFPEAISWVRFFSAAASLDLARAQDECGVELLDFTMQQQQREQEERRKTMKRSLQQQQQLRSLTTPTDITIRHERLFKHPVSTGCMFQSGCNVRVDNRPAGVAGTTSTASTAASTSSTTSSTNAKSSSTTHNRQNTKSRQPVRWSLYWGGRWRDERLFKKELLSAMPQTDGSFRINHFPGTHQLARKDNLAIQLQKMRLKFPSEYSFVPQTFILPRDAALFSAELKNTNTSMTNKADDGDDGGDGGGETIFIAKPPASSRGRGVYLFRAKQVPKEVQQVMIGAAAGSVPGGHKQLSKNSAPSSQAGKTAMLKRETQKTKNATATNVTSSSHPASKTRRRTSSSFSATSGSDAASEETGGDTSSRTSCRGDGNEDDDDDNDDDADDDDVDDDGSILIQKYIPNPLLIHGYKVDLRVYACCTSFDPLKVFVFNDGLVRFATVPFSSSSSSSSASNDNRKNNSNNSNENNNNNNINRSSNAPLSNLCAHLTNVSVNNLSTKHRNNEHMMMPPPRTDQSNTKKKKMINNSDDNGDCDGTGGGGTGDDGLKRKQYQPTDSPEQDGTEEGSKWTLQALKKYINTQHNHQHQHQHQHQHHTCNDDNDNDDNDNKKASSSSSSSSSSTTWDQCWARVCETITKVFIAVQDEVASKVSSIVQKRNACFELYGFDILLDDALRPHVLEVNVLPSLVCGSALDRHIKGHMIADMLSLAGVGLVLGKKMKQQPEQEEGGEEEEENPEHRQDGCEEEEDATTSTTSAAKMERHVESSLNNVLNCPIVSSTSLRNSNNRNSSAIIITPPNTKMNPKHSSSQAGVGCSEEDLQNRLHSLIKDMVIRNAPPKLTENKIATSSTKTTTTPNTNQKKSTTSTSKNNSSNSSKSAASSFLSSVTKDSDRAIVTYSEEELARRGGWERVFPNAWSVSRLHHLFSPPHSSSSSSSSSSLPSTTVGGGGSVTRNSNNNAGVVDKSVNCARRGNRILWAWEAVKSSIEPAAAVDWMRNGGRVAAGEQQQAAVATIKKKTEPPPPPSPRTAAPKPPPPLVPRAAKQIPKKQQPDKIAPAVASSAAAPISCQVFSFHPVSSVKPSFP